LPLCPESCRHQGLEIPLQLLGGSGAAPSVAIAEKQVDQNASALATWCLVQPC
jgi:hypothetical protein